MDCRQALRQVLFLKTVQEAAIAALIAAGAERRLEKGEPLFAEFERCQGLFVVLTGAVKVYKLDSRGRELTLSLELPGESVGELPLFDGGNYPYSAEAVQGDTRIWYVPRDHFRAIMRDYPGIAERGLLALGVRLRRMVQIAEAQSLYTVRARLATYLLEISNGRTLFRLEETNEAISSHLGTVREVVSRTLRTLKDSQVIGLRGRWVTVLDEAELRRAAGTDPSQ
jgi:CRP-like cAMP-binding protein